MKQKAKSRKTSYKKESNAKYKNGNKEIRVYKTKKKVNFMIFKIKKKTMYKQDE